VWLFGEAVAAVAADAAKTLRAAHHWGADEEPVGG
jgi:hypothetical protein